MAAVIHHLWERGDRNPLILPGSIALEDARIQSEADPVPRRQLDADHRKGRDGADSLPLQIDGEQPNLGKLAAGRRVARAIFLGSAPTAGAAHRGIDDAASSWAA